MSVRKEPNGRRSIQVDIEVPGTPEEVWQTIATGPGISAWFVPATFEEEGGKPQGKAPEAGEEPPSRGAHEPARPLGDEEGAEVEEGEDPDEGHLTPPGEGGPRAGPR